MVKQTGAVCELCEREIFTSYRCDKCKRVVCTQCIVFDDDQQRCQTCALKAAYPGVAK